MTVQTAVKMWSRHDASFTSEKGKRRKASIREAYQVICDPTDTLKSVSIAPGLPLLDDLYPGTSQVRVKTMTPRQVSPIYWIVEIQYAGPYGAQGIDKSPLDDRPIVSFGKTDSTEPVDQDANGNAIVTANGEPIEGVTKNLSDVTCSIKRNYRGIDLGATYQYLHSVNSDQFLGFAPGVVKLTEFTANEKFSEDIGGYWEVNAGFQMRWPYNTTPERAWWTRLRHEGYRVKVGSEVVNAQDGRLQDVSKPVLLKPDGTQQTDPSQCHWLEIPIYQPLPYRALGLL